MINTVKYERNLISDAHRRTVSVTDALGGTTQFVYDALGQLLASTDPEGFQTTYAYDMLGRMTYRSHPDAAATQNAYDPAGNLLAQTSAAGETVSYGYDFMRPVAKRYSRFPENGVQYHYDSAGRVDTVRDGSGMRHLEYDALGNIARETRTLGVPYSGFTYTFTTEYEYDSWGRMLSTTYPDSETLSYGYDTWDGDLATMAGDKGAEYHDYVTGITYNNFGQCSRVDYGNGTSAVFR